MAFSKYAADIALNLLKGTNAPTAPANMYVALHNGNPTATGTGGTEVTATIRTAGRVLVTLGAITSPSGAEQVANTVAEDFGNAAAGATYDHFSLWDSATPGQGNMWRYEGVTGGAVTVSTGTDVQFPVGQLVDMVQDLSAA